MNGFGVGAAIAIGIEIGATIVSPELDFVYVLMLMLLYGMFTGYIFAIWRIALNGIHLPAFADGGRRSPGHVIKFLRAFFSRNRSS
ncbi:MAG: hypothetical protein MUP15_07350 [Dehalococcoidia bacterium]|nr:hypothetical protein [Dehalococcoidia bacterium]